MNRLVKFWRRFLSNHMRKAMLRSGATLTRCPSCNEIVPHYEDGMTRCLICRAELIGRIREYPPASITPTEVELRIGFNVGTLRPNEFVRMKLEMI